MRPNYIPATETYFKIKDKDRLKMKEWGKIYYANANQKKAEVAILTSHTDFRARNIIGDRDIT